MIIGEDKRTGDLLGEIESGGRRRTFRLHLPASRRGESKLPLVFMLHGSGGNAWNAARVSGFSAAADANGFAVCYPDGTGAEKYRLGWNAGYGIGYPDKNSVDDVAFIADLLEHLKSEFLINTGRIYAAGISNGGMMALRLAAEISPQLAGAASVAGAMPPLGVEPMEPVSVIFINGTADEYVPYEGGKGVKNDGPGFSFIPLSEGVSYWTRANRVFPGAHTESLGGLYKGIGTASVFDELAGGEYPEAVIETFGRGAGGAEVCAVTVNGGLHAWPGGEPGWRGGDAPSQAISATETIWSFFNRHRK